MNNIETKVATKVSTATKVMLAAVIIAAFAAGAFGLKNMSNIAKERKLINTTNEISKLIELNKESVALNQLLKMDVGLRTDICYRLLSIESLSFSKLLSVATNEQFEDLLAPVLQRLLIDKNDFDVLNRVMADLDLEKQRIMYLVLEEPVFERLLLSIDPKITERIMATKSLSPLLSPL